MPPSRGAATPREFTPSTPPPRTASASLVRSALGKIDELWDDEEAAVQARLACVYPEMRNRGPKKRLSKTQRILREIKRDLELALSGGTAVDPLSAASEEEDSTVEDDGMDGFEPTENPSFTLRNPLAVLACHGDRVEPDFAHRGRPELAEQIHLGGLYNSRPETDFSLDPVQAGIITSTDLERLINLYFQHLRPFLWLLIPELHSVDSLRISSPFLTTAIAAVSAAYDPLSADLIAALRDHALQLATRVVHGGLRSLEIVQAFFILSHWANPSTPTTDSRSWQWLGQAWRIATELRIDLPPVPPGKPLDVHAKNRLSTFSLLFCGELAMAVQTGRIDCLRLVPPSASHLSPTAFAPEVPDYHYSANLAVNVILAKALHLAAGLREEVASDDLRRSFLSFWRPQMEEWRKRWPDINPFIDVHAENNTIILNLMSLGFTGGSTEAILADCRASAIRTIQKVTSWEDRETQLPFASNYVIVNIAYGAGLLLQLSQRFKHDVDFALQQKILRVAEILERIGKDRPNAPSMATSHAARLRRMVEAVSPSAAATIPQEQPPAAAASVSAPIPYVIPPPFLPPHYPPPTTHPPPTSATALPSPLFPPYSSTLPDGRLPDLPSRSESAALDFAGPLPDAARDFLGMAASDPMLAWMQSGDFPGNWEGWEAVFGSVEL
ncbi:hypothetical protein JCM6882_007845 [Rhodosporidiobolus microsporus]